MTSAGRARRADRILIVGGGIAGLSLAMALRRWDLHPEIVERAEAWGPAGAGLYLIGAATRALGALGLADEAVDKGAVTRVQTFRDHRGNRLAEVDVHRYWQECGPCFGISRAALHRLLAERIAGVPVRFGTSVLALRQEGSGVSVELTDGSSESYDLVVGADGMRSIVRRLTLGDSEPRFRGQVGWRFIARQTPTSPDGWTVYLGAGGAFLVVPIGPDTVYCYADRMAPTPEAEASGWNVSRLRERFRRFGLPVQEMLGQLALADQPHRSPIEEAAHEAWGRGRVVLIGDAAHAMSPNMACGVAMALEDSLALAEIIAQADGATDVAQALARRRSARVRWVWRQTNQRDRLRRLPSAVRNLVLRGLAGRTYRANYRPLLEPP
jgi:2-polyprenyl-6-methoxyphenol hydroxylase-like FAD-dependent oxidoreductase